MINSPITLEALLVLDAIENRGSFAAAAEQLNKVPSALSYIVQKLEEQLSVTIFVRQGRRSVLTPAGRHLLEEGRKVLGVVSNITEQVQTIAHGWEPRLRVACDSIIDINDVLPAISNFLAEHPTIEIDLSEEVMNGSWEALIEDKVDLLIGAPSPIPNQKGIRTQKLMSLNHVLVVPTGHELTLVKHPITESDLQHYRTVIVHDTAKQAVPWSANIVEQSQHFYVQTVEQKIKAIIAGIGIGFLPENRITSELSTGQVAIVEVAESRRDVDIYLAWKIINKGKGLQKLVNLLC